MAAFLVQQEPVWLIRLEGEAGIACAAELKNLLLAWLAAGRNLELDLEGAVEIDITIMQLIWAAAYQAARTGLEIVVRASPDGLQAVREAGFGPPGFPLQD